MPKRLTPRLFETVLVIVPGLLGLTALYFLRDTPQNVVLIGSYQIDLATLLLWVGIILSLGLESRLLLTRQANHRIQVVRIEEQRRADRQVQEVRTEEQQFADRRVQEARAEEREIAGQQARTAQNEEQQARAAAHQRFLRHLHHELENPVTTIRLGLVNLQGASLTDEECHSLNRIAQQIERIGKLIEGLGRLSDLEEGRLQKANVNLSHVLEEAVLLVQAKPKYLNRSISTSLQQAPWPLSSVQGDYNLLVSVFYNLLDNALKYSAENDRVDIRATDDGQAVEIEIADTGLGIPPADVSEVFEELHRGENVQDEKDGSGLGLALVKRVIDLHGGEIHLVSRLGQGTVFIVHLPIMLPSE